MLMINKCSVIKALGPDELRVSRAESALHESKEPFFSILSAFDLPGSRNRET